MAPTNSILNSLYGPKTMTVTEQEEYRRDLALAQDKQDRATVGEEAGKALLELRARKNREYAAAINTPQFGDFVRALVAGMARWGARNGLPIEAVKPVSPAVWASDGRLIIEFQRDPEVEL